VTRKKGGAPFLPGSTSLPGIQVPQKKVEGCLFPEMPPREKNFPHPPFFPSPALREGRIDVFACQRIIRGTFFAAPRDGWSAFHLVLDPIRITHFPSIHLRGDFTLQNGIRHFTLTRWSLEKWADPSHPFPISGLRALCKNPLGRSRLYLPPCWPTRTTPPCGCGASALGGGKAKLGPHNRLACLTHTRERTLV